MTARSRTTATKKLVGKKAGAKKAGGKKASAKKLVGKKASATKHDTGKRAVKSAPATKGGATKADAKKIVGKKAGATPASEKQLPSTKVIAAMASTAAALAPAIERLHARLELATTTLNAGAAVPTTLNDGAAAPTTLNDGGVAPSVADTARPSDARAHRDTALLPVPLAQDEDVPSLAHLLDHSMPWWTLDLGTEVGQQIVDASRYLLRTRGDAAPYATPAATAFPWELLITRVGEIMYRTLAPATARARRLEFADVLRLWLASGFPAHVRELRGADFMVPAAMVSGMDRHFSTRLVTWGNRYFVRYFQPLANGRAGVRVLEHADGGAFRVPEGVELGEHVLADVRFDDRAIRAVLELLETRGPVPFDASVSRTIAQRTGLSEAAATLVWTAGYEPWLVGEKKRAEMGLARDALDAAEGELAKPRLREIYVDAMPADPAQLYEPAALAARVADAWLVYRTGRDARREQAQGTN